MQPYIKELRCSHWIKNLLIILPLFCSGNIQNSHKLFNVIIGILIFSLTSSIVYIFNDLYDIEYDRQHPIKKNRPIANGDITRTQAIRYMMIIIALITIFNIATYNLKAAIILIAYVIINILYTIKYKNIVLIDVCIIATCFILRLLYGAILSNIEISHWLYLTVLSAAFYFGFQKRKTEIKNKDNYTTRKVIQNYSYEFINNQSNLFKGLLIIFYSLWTINNETINRHNKNLIWSIPIIIIILLRYEYIMETHKNEDPTDIIYKDKVILLLTILYMISMAILLYVPPIK